MWFNCMRFVTEEGIPVRELEQLAGTKTNLKGMEHWGYVRIEPGPNDGRPLPRSRWLIRPTRAGRNAQEIWSSSLAAVEERWRQRFGKAQIDQRRKSLCALIEQLDIELPDCLPILGYGLFSKGGFDERRKPVGHAQHNASHLPLPSLLSKLLLVFALEFENESQVSLPASANVLRLIGPEGVSLRDLPRLSGVRMPDIHIFTFCQRSSSAGRPASAHRPLACASLGRKACRTSP
jgi:hypothetical protein